MMTILKIYRVFFLPILFTALSFLWSGVSNASCAWMNDNVHTAVLTLDFNVASPTNVSFRRTATTSFRSTALAQASGVRDYRSYIVKCDSQSDIVRIGGSTLNIGPLNGGGGYYMKPLTDVDIGLQATSTTGSWIYPSAAGGDVSFTVGQIFTILGYDYAIYGGTLSWYYLLGLGGDGFVNLYSGANLSGGGTMVNTPGRKAGGCCRIIQERQHYALFYRDIRLLSDEAHDHDNTEEVHTHGKY